MLVTRALHRLGLLIFLALGGLLILGPRAALAQDQKIPGLSLQRFRPAPNPGDYLTVYGSGIENHLRITGGLYLNWADNPLELIVSAENEIEASRQGVIDYQFFADFFASISLYEWAEIGIVLPVGLAQASETGGVPFDQSPTTTGLGDLRLVAKGRILKLGEYAPVGVAGVVSVGFPTGDSEAFYGDGGVSFDAVVAVDYNPWSSMRLGLNVGYRFRPETAEIGRFTIGDAIILSGALTLPLFRDDLDLLAEINGEIGVDSTNEFLSSEERPVEGEIGVRYRVYDGEGVFNNLALTGAVGVGTSAIGAPDVRVLLGVGYFWVAGGTWAQDYRYGGHVGEIKDCPEPGTVPESEIPRICRELKPKEPDSDGDGVPDKQDACPFKGIAGEIDERGCPNNDRDLDGIPDHEDACPEVAEDKDGFEDEDGCPELDNDQDTIADVQDDCPIEPEIFNGIDDQDGCPDNDPNAKVQVRDGKVEIKEQVFFETNKAKIKSESNRLLNEVADLLVNNPQIGSIDIEGHTDDRGDDDYNKKLSQKRAEAVGKYLANRGVEESRLNPIGYGEEQPIADNETKDGRAKNRRVEFTIRGLPKSK